MEVLIIMPIKGIDEIDLDQLTQVTNSSDPTHLLDFMVNEAGLPFAETFIIVISIIVFVGMKSQDYETLDCFAATVWLSSILSGFFLFMNLIDETWLIGSLAVTAFVTFQLWYRNRS